MEAHVPSSQRPFGVKCVLLLVPLARKAKHPSQEGGKPSCRETSCWL